MESSYTSASSSVETGNWTIVKRKKNQINTTDDTQTSLTTAYENLKVFNSQNIFINFLQATQEAVAIATIELKQLLKVDSKENISINLSVSPAGSPTRSRSPSPKSPIGAERPNRPVDAVDFSPFYSRR